MARWPKRTVTVEPDANGEAYADLLKGDANRLGFIIRVPDDATHSVNVSLDGEPASATSSTFLLEPGDELDTTELRPEQQPE